MIIAIYGGVGTGKSTVLDILKNNYNADIIKADDIGHELYEPGCMGSKIIAKLTGGNVIDKSGRVDRKKLAGLLYNDKALKKNIEDNIHPIIIDEIKRRIRESKKALIAVEAALPFADRSDLFDEIWYVYSSRETRIKRLVEDRGYSRQRSELIMDNQLSDNEFKNLATRIIDNEGELSDLEKQIKNALDGRLDL